MATTLRPCPACNRPMDAARDVCVFCQQAGVSGPETIEGAGIETPAVAPTAGSASGPPAASLGCFFGCLVCLVAPVFGLWLYGSLFGSKAQPLTGWQARAREQILTRIRNSRDCAALQREFDQAEANFNRELQQGNEAAKAVSREYMEAADRRMEEIGCYGRSR